MSFNGYVIIPMVDRDHNYVYFFLSPYINENIFVTVYIFSMCITE